MFILLYSLPYADFSFKSISNKVGQRSIKYFGHIGTAFNVDVKAETIGSKLA